MATDGESEPMAAPSGAAPHKRTAEELAEVMRQRREQCTVLESVPDASTADSGTARMSAPTDPQTQVWESNPDGSAADAAAGRAAPAGAHVPASGISYIPRQAASKAQAASDVNVSRWMEKIRDRCQVYESLPEPGAADFQWSAATPVPKGEQGAPRAVARLPHRGPSEAASDLDAPGDESAVEVALPADETANIPAVSSSSKPLQESERLKVWQEHLQPNGSPKAIAEAVRKLLHLCHSDSASESELQELADSFAPKYMPIIEESSFPPVCGLLSQLLWYHFPRIASTVASAAQTGNSTLQDVVFRSCGGSGPVLADRLLAAGSQAEAASILVVCDAAILEQRETLLVFVLLALLGQASLRESAALDEVVSIWSEAAGSLGRLGAEEVHAILELAHDLYEVTPVCLASAWPSRDFTGQDLRVCSATPDEVLRHIYEQPTSSWRFVVVDVRTNVDTHVALPVSIRIESSEDRASVLAEMPYEECIHLCLVGDGPSTSSDDEAVGLCTTLCGDPTWRKHVSVVEGGWAAIQALVQSMGLELMDVELERAAEALEEAGESVHTENSFRTAAVGLGQKVARRSRKLTSGFLKGATKALQRLSDDISEMTENLTGGHPSEMPKRPRRREVEFDQGTLGFDLQGNVVKLVDADGQAAAGGVGVGDRLVAVEGREVPMPPDTDTQEVRDQRVKRLIKKWIKEQRRPVKLTFEPPSGME
mmetsp:Transcript_54431/g.100587  ORF Transcript_54431/g.100587 Transcript_54431/m.100587 type:complete len:712 (-) Transcript_54431:133-2268(-)